MSFTEEMQGTAQRLSNSVDQMKKLFTQHGVTAGNLRSTIQTNPQFKAEWLKIWKDIIKQDGGKFSLTTFGAVLGASLGGAGIAALGGAIGVPLAVVLGCGGLLAGTELDSWFKRFKSEKVKVQIPRELYAHIEKIAGELHSDPETLIAAQLATAFEFKSGT